MGPKKDHNQQVKSGGKSKTNVSIEQYSAPTRIEMQRLQMELESSMNEYREEVGDGELDRSTQESCRSKWEETIHKNSQLMMSYITKNDVVINSLSNKITNVIDKEISEIQKHIENFESSTEKRCTGLNDKIEKAVTKINKDFDYSIQLMEEKLNKKIDEMIKRVKGDINEKLRENNEIIDQVMNDQLLKLYRDNILPEINEITKKKHGRAR